MDRDAVREAHVDLEGANQQRAHGPLVAVVFIEAGRPRRQEGVHHAPDVVAKRYLVRRVEAHPEAVHAVRGVVKAKDREEGSKDGCNGGWQHQAWHAAEGAAGDGMEGGGRVAVLTGKLERFQGAHEARQEGEHGHADAPLPWQAQEWQLQQARRGLGIVGGPEEWVVKGARDVRRDHKDGGDTTESLAARCLASERGHTLPQSHADTRHVERVRRRTYLDPFDVPLIGAHAEYGDVGPCQHDDTKDGRAT